MSADPRRRVRVEAHGDDVDGAARFFGAGYGGVGGLRFVETERPFSWRHTTRGDGELTLRTTHFSGEVTGTIQPRGERVVQWIGSGSALMDIGRDEVVPEIGRPMPFPYGRPFSFRVTDVEQNLLHVADSVLDEVASEREQACPGSVRFDHATPITDDALGRFNAALRRIARTYLDDEADDAARAETARFAAGILLDTFPHSSRRLPDVVLAPRNASLRQAVEYVHGRAHEPITPSGVAHHARLTPRGLQQAFSRHLDTTPSEYLRAVRLDRVRDELLEGSPDTVTVAEVAQRWAFAHLGRFSASYVQRFDEYPRETLQRT
jgi:AraC-like DNA-binding protein